jgi:phosphatidate cytidylyltransferase
MPDNPFRDPFFLTVLSRVAGAFVLLMIGALLRERRRRRNPEERSLIIPVTTAAVVTFIFLLALFAGGAVLIAFAALVGLAGLSEYARITTLGRYYYGLTAIWTVTGTLLAAFSSIPLPLLPLMLFLVVTLIPILSGQVGGALQQAGAALFGYIYIGLPMAYMVFVRSREPWGLRFLLIVCVAVWLSDTCGYTIGSRVKGPKLAPLVSPGKTWSGAIGSVAGAVAGVLVMQAIIPLGWGLAELVPLTVLAALSAIWSDLIESFIKRDFRVKDAGSMLPGFGGVLDRFDSLLITIPITYYAILGIRYLAR